MASPSRSRNNLIAGTFVVVCLAGFFAASVVLSGVGDRLKATHAYEVRFPLEVGAPGLTPGSAVTLGGQQVGRVTGVEIVTGENGVPEGVGVGVRIGAGLVLFEDARFELVRPLVGAGAVINIAHPGGLVEHPRGAGPELEPGETVAGAVAAPSFLADAGYGSEQRDQLRAVLSNAERASGDIARASEALATSLPETAEDIRAAAERARGFLETSEQWEAQIMDILVALEGGADDAQAGLGEAREALSELREVVSENRAPIAEMVASLTRSAGRVENEIIADFSEAMMASKEAADLFRDVASESDSIITGQRPNIERTLANFRLASDQVKLAAVEARAMPWRVFNKPTRREIREQLIYDAAQSYMVAAIELSQTSDALIAAVERSAAREDEHDEQLGEVRRSLGETLERYQSAADQLLDYLSAPAPPAE